MNDSLLRCALFSGVTEEEWERGSTCLAPRTAVLRAGQTALRRGEPVQAVGVVLEGRLQIVKDDFWGRRTIVGQAEAGDVFGEAYALTRGVAEVDAVAAGPAKAAMLSLDRLLTPCGEVCPFHRKVIQNLLRLTAEKNRMLMRRMEHISQKTTRDKVLSLLSAYAAQQGKDRFLLPFDRQELADYLSVDRSALSRELGRLREQGVIAFHKNEFCLLKKTEGKA